MFTDGVHLGVVLVDANEKFMIRFLNTVNCSTVDSELQLKLARKSVDVFGSSIIGKSIFQFKISPLEGSNPKLNWIFILSTPSGAPYNDH